MLEGDEHLQHECSPSKCVKKDADKIPTKKKQENDSMVDNDKEDMMLWSHFDVSN